MYAPGHVALRRGQDAVRAGTGSSRTRTGTCRRPATVAVARRRPRSLRFQELDAACHVDAASALLRTLGGPARTGPKGREKLTRREQEVLELLAHALSSAEIAERLFISTKTVELHVGRILSKVGLRSRAEAAVHALRAGKQGST